MVLYLLYLSYNKTVKMPSEASCVSYAPSGIWIPHMCDQWSLMRCLSKTIIVIVFFYFKYDKYPTKFYIRIDHRWFLSWFTVWFLQRYWLVIAKRFSHLHWKVRPKFLKLFRLAERQQKDTASTVIRPNPMSRLLVSSAEG